MSDIALKPFQPNVDTVAKLTIAGGAASFDGTILYDGVAGSAPRMSCRGNLRVDGFDARDRAHSEDLLKWKSLALSGIKMDVSPTRLHIDDILFSGPYTRVIIFPDRTVNLAAVFAREKGDEAHTAPPPAEKKTGEENGPVPITIGAIRMKMVLKTLPIFPSRRTSPPHSGYERYHSPGSPPILPRGRTYLSRGPWTSMPLSVSKGRSTP